MNRMKAELKLTDKQVEQSYADPEGAGRKKLTALRPHKSIAAGNRKARSQEIRDAADAKIKPLLKGERPDQWRNSSRIGGNTTASPRKS